MNSELFLIAAYAIIWGGLFGYILYTAGQQHILAGRVRILEELLVEQGVKND